MIRGEGPNQYRILIVGGGTAGWLTANLLHTLLNEPGRENFKITVVESPTTPRIGVGEATLPTLTQTLQDLGIPEGLFLQRTHATFKHAIRFEGWADGSDAYFHPFESFSHLKPDTPRDYLSALAGFARRQGVDPAVLWWHKARNAESGQFASAIGVQPWLCDARRAPRPIGAPEYFGKVTYAYHTNAELFADLLAEHARARLIDHVLDDVTGVELSPAGDIAAVQTRVSGRITADLFVDCTGFAAILIGRTLGVPLASFAQHLLCDRAIAIPVRRGDEEPRPFTTCRALEAGWMWEIDLMNRTGSGYVYSSAFTTDVQAEAVLRSQLGERAERLEARKLRMNVGHRETFWKGNCVAVGLAAGFLEPLESTGIYLIELGARLIADYLGRPAPNPAGVRQYNQLMREQFEELRDFIVLHYCLTRRQEPFWREVVQATHIPESLQEKLVLWKSYFPASHHSKQSLPLVHAENYQAILFGMGWDIEHPQGRMLLRRPTHLDGAEQLLHSAVERALTELPRHVDLIRSILTEQRAEEPVVFDLALEAGVAVAGLACDPHRLRLSSGTSEPGTTGLDPTQYHAGARVPARPWRSPTAAERSLLTAVPQQRAPGLVVGVFQVPPQVVARFRSALPDVGVPDREISVPPTHEREAIETAASELSSQFSDDPASALLGLLINRSGWATITGDKFDGKRIGLHFDSWSQMPLADRVHAPNRVCVNLGSESRWLLFINLPAARILELLRERDVDVGGAGPTDVARLFMRMCPGYPVVGVEVRPGEAYVAPTENVIHDGSSESMRSADITFTGIGRFDKHLFAAELSAA